MPSYAVMWILLFTGCSMYDYVGYPTQQSDINYDKSSIVKNTTAGETISSFDRLEA
jgi:hypothetical protein